MIFEGVIKNILTQNESDGFAVFRIDAGVDGEITVKGNVGTINRGEKAIIEGEWTEHPVYGLQIRADFVRCTLPENPKDILAYLSSGVLVGIGPATAISIVDKFGEDTFNIIENHPEELAKIRGIGAKKAQEISASFNEKISLRRVTDFLAEFGISTITGVRLYNCYGKESLKKLEENPYIICSDAIGDDFFIADELARAMDVTGESYFRLSAAVIYELRHNLGNGHSFIPLNKLANATSILLKRADSESEENISPDDIIPVIDRLNSEKSIVIKNIGKETAVYLPELDIAESIICGHIHKLNADNKVNEKEFNRRLKICEMENGIVYESAQREAILKALQNNLVIITGGPGTGKTTIVRALCSLLEMQGDKYVLCAPTGRAAKRLNQVTSREAYTIHRLLEAKREGDSDRTTFNKNASSPLKYKYIIVDECSMIDVLLFKALFDASGKNVYFVLVGDADQLPPVGPGNVFSDFIKSEKIVTIRLNEVFRQSNESNIIINAHKINKGIVPDLRENKKGFYRMVRFGESVGETVVDLVSRRLPQNMSVHPEDIQVLSPTKKGSSGTVALNTMLQAALNPSRLGKKELKYGNKIFREGDRVMVTRNNYDIIWTDEHEESGSGVFNGDMGVIERVSPTAGEIDVNLDGKVALFAGDDIRDLDHAWAVTVHKSQGSEFNTVVLCLPEYTANTLMTRSVLYTGVSRAKNNLIILCRDDDFVRMVMQDRVSKRYSGICARLSEINE